MTFFWDKYNEDLKIFYKAFIQKNKLYQKENPNDKKDETPIKKANRIVIFLIMIIFYCVIE